MRAHEVPVGFGFVGSVERDDWFMEDKRLFSGELVTVVAMFPAPTGEDEERLVMNLYAGLRWENGCQVGSNHTMWVAGVRPKRSKFVRIFDWQSRCSLAAAAKVELELISHHVPIPPET